ncbi:lysophospholipase D GDPD1-like isoform X2 [Symsagittifera roscoffensis]|uniref:lysophospholipase D GDPD1-like isoform X2 n=1 Tax=Symsagittifera roscoffensis TaxID=84072 RepID=UPI00307B9139
MVSLAVEVTLGVFCAYFLVSTIVYFFPAILHKRKRSGALGRKGMTIAHRGGSCEFLENTMTAFRNAVKVGADVIELDVQLTKDKKVVVCHDNNLERLTGEKKLINQTCYSDLPKITSPQMMIFPQECVVDHHDRQIPLLEEVFEEFPHTTINLDVKEQDASLRTQVEFLIRKFGRENLTVWGSWHDSVCKQLFKLNPNIPLIMSMRKIVIHAFIFWTGLLPFIPIKETFYEPPACKAMFANQDTTLTRKLVIYFVDFIVGNWLLIYHYKRRGIVCWCWIVNEQSHFKCCFDKFDGVMTDRISALVQYVASSEDLKNKQQTSMSRSCSYSCNMSRKMSSKEVLNGIAVGKEAKDNCPNYQTIPPGLMSTGLEPRNGALSLCRGDLHHLFARLPAILL